MPIQRDRETSSNQNETIIFTCWRFIRDDFAHFVFHHTRGQLSFQHRPPRPVRCWLRYSRAACRIRTTSSLFLSNPQEPPVPCESIESSMNLRFCTEESTPVWKEGGYYFVYDIFERMGTRWEWLPREQFRNYRKNLVLKECDGRQRTSGLIYDLSSTIFPDAQFF
jgi:hypothetical protein